MLIRPIKDELANFGAPDFVIINAGAFPTTRGYGLTAIFCVQLHPKVSDAPYTTKV